MMAIKSCTFFFLFLIGLGLTTALASNLQLTNLDEVSVNAAANTMTFSFNLNQDNSWRNATNYDAVWVFMKYSIDGGATWNHATMAGSGINPAGFLVPNGYQIFVPADGKGFFLQRSGYGSGSMALTNVQFVWNYALDGVSGAVAQAANTLHTIYGIEMVYIPQGAFYAGDGSSGASLCFYPGQRGQYALVCPK
jgi:hypothetical protein